MDELFAELVQGRIGALVVARDAVVWGSVDEATGHDVHVRDEPGTCDVDLLETAARVASDLGAEVHAVDASSFSAGRLFAAEYRY